MSFQSPVVLTTKPLNQTSTTAKESVNFAQLLSVFTAEGQIPSEEVITEKIATETPQVKLLEKLEDVLQVLQGLPKENLSPEQQEMMNAIIQMLSLQTVQLEENLQVTESSVEKVMVSNPSQDKLMNLLHQVEQELKSLMSKASVKQFEDDPKIMGVEDKNILADPKKVEQIFKQLIEFTQQLETEQQSAGKHTPLKQLEQLEQVLKQMNNLSQELTSHTQSIDSELSIEANVESTTRQVTETTVKQLSNVDSLPLEAIQNEESSSILMATASDITKTSQASGRPESSAPVQAPTVRMTNLIEELGEVLRGSFRLNGTGEGTQIKVNIFPEHLGHLDIRITELNGKIAAQIFTSSSVAKEALDLQVNQLRNSLLQQGITIEKIEIMQQHSSQFGQQNAHPDQRFSQQQKQGNASHNKNGYQRLEEEVTIERNHAVTGQMKIDYTI
ncbi:flagellar hook-length control protein FliK [Paenisporosarcina sp.]|uniref:flagellar hook-length control protein FliK n=1 Tax=Paenisporosarcina sp. TaxID=1932001 RepID=UPI003C738304